MLVFPKIGLSLANILCRTTTDPIRMELSRHISTWLEMGEQHMDRFRLHSNRTYQKQKHALYASSNYFITIGSAAIECSLLKAAIFNHQYHRYHQKMLKYFLISHQQTTCKQTYQQVVANYANAS